LLHFHTYHISKLPHSCEMMPKDIPVNGLRRKDAAMKR